MANDIPVACLLTDKELQARRKDHLEKLAVSLVDFTESKSGYIYRFPLKDSILRDLAEIIDLERKCCPFLSFGLSVESGESFVQLELSGPENSKEMIQSLFDWNYMTGTRISMRV